MLRTLVAVASLLSLLASAGCAKKSTASARDGTRLSLKEPSDQTVKQGDTNRVAIKIDRVGFAEPVKVTFSNLPQGVRVEEDTIPAGDESKDFTLVAAADAAVVNKQIVTVHAHGNGIDTAQTFELTVKPRGA